MGRVMLWTNSTVYEGRDIENEYSDCQERREKKAEHVTQLLEEQD